MRISSLKMIFALLCSTQWASHNIVVDVYVAETVILFVTKNIRGTQSWVPLECFGVLDHRPLFKGPESQALSKMLGPIFSVSLFLSLYVHNRFYLFIKIFSICYSFPLRDSIFIHSLDLKCFIVYCNLLLLRTLHLKHHEGIFLCQKNDWFMYIDVLLV